MPDYRNREPVDAPRIFAIERRHVLALAACFAVGLPSWYLVAVAGGLAW